MIQFYVCPALKNNCGLVELAKKNKTNRYFHLEGESCRSTLIAPIVPPIVRDIE